LLVWFIVNEIVRIERKVYQGEQTMGARRRGLAYLEDSRLDLD